jgi:AraC-like DNA-binding protein
VVCTFSFCNKNPGIVFSFRNTKINYRDFLQELAVALGVQVVSNRVSVPANVGTGSFSLIELPNGLLVIFIDYQLNTDLVFERPASREEMYTLRFERIRHIKKLTTKINDDSYTETQPERSIVYLTCSLFDLGFTSSAGTQTTALSIQLPRNWLAKYLKMDTYETILEEYLSLKTATLLAEPINAAYINVLDELKSMDMDHPALRTIANNRIMELVELFFTRLYERRNQLKLPVKASAKDIESIRKVEAYITKDYRLPVATIKELSRMSAMSATKLKKLFKDIYDKPIYQYYLFNKMSRAKSMLLSGNYAVKEAAMELGYSNVSSFSAAFKKVFGSLPGNLVK